MSIAGTRINTLLLLLVIGMAAAIISMLGSRAYGGPLDPPSAPASTDGVRGPGTPISSVPFAITQPGRYYLTRNVTGNVITIDADDVVLDLGGFTMNGLGNGTGVSAPASHADVSIEHGVITNYQRAIDLGLVAFGHIRDIQTNTNLSGGTAITTQSRGVLEDCLVFGGTNGVFLSNGTVMRRCEVGHSNAYGVFAKTDTVIEDSIIDANFSGGIQVNNANVTVRNNRLSLNGAGNDVDVTVIGGTAVVIDNEIHCIGSVSATPPGQMDTSSPEGQHVNIPRFGAGFC